MAQKCIDCGKELSFWSKIFPNDRKLCPACKNIKKEKVEKFISRLNEFGLDRYLDSQEEQELVELQQSLGLTAEDLREAQRKLINLRRLTRNADIARYEEKLVQVGEDGYLSPQEESELNELKEQLDLADDEISYTYGKLTRLKRLTAIKDGNLPVLAADILLKKGEQCHYEISTEDISYGLSCPTGFFV